MPKNSAHDEVTAIGMVKNALEPLAADERLRVLRWAGERYGAPVSVSPRPGFTVVEPVGTEADDPSEFYAQASPETDAERALVIAYWVQEVEKKGEFDSQTVNTKLKNLGHGVGNITRAIDDLKGRKPQLVIQIEKSGKSQQARKRFKVTGAGKAEVQRMHRGESSE
jgi:hypothetical protein